MLKNVLRSLVPITWELEQPKQKPNSYFFFSGKLYLSPKVLEKLPKKEINQIKATAEVEAKKQEGINFCLRFSSIKRNDETLLLIDKTTAEHSYCILLFEEEY